MQRVEEVALFAVLLRAVSVREHGYGMPRATPVGFDFDEELLMHNGPDISLAVMFAHEHFTEADWDIARILQGKPNRPTPPSFVKKLAKRLYITEDTLRAEALLHALGQRTRARWAAPFMERERWGRIRAAMDVLTEELGITKRRDELVDVACDAVKRAKPWMSDEQVSAMYQLFIPTSEDTAESAQREMVDFLAEVDKTRPE